MNEYNSSQKPRAVDAKVRTSMKFLKDLRLVGSSTVRKWHLWLTIIFIVGFISAVVWMISTDRGTGSLGAAQYVAVAPVVVYEDASGVVGPLTGYAVSSYVAGKDNIQVASDAHRSTIIKAIAVRNSFDKSIFIPGEQLTYQLVVANLGSSALNNVVIAAEITASGNIESVSHSQEAEFSSGFVSWNIGALEPDESVERTVTIATP